MKIYNNLLIVTFTNEKNNNINIALKELNAKNCVNDTCLKLTSNKQILLTQTYINKKVFIQALLIHMFCNKNIKIKEFIKKLIIEKIINSVNGSN